MKLRLADQGDGWFWDSPAIEAEVTAESWGHSRLYFQVRLPSPLQRQRRDGTAGSGSSPALYRAAWVSSRWVGHELSSEHDTSAFLWLVGLESEPVPPSADSSPSARVKCRMVP